MPTFFSLTEPDETHPAFPELEGFVPRQPEGVPSRIAYFISFLKLGTSLAFALRSVYIPHRLKEWLGIEKMAYENIVMGIGMW